MSPENTRPERFQGFHADVILFIVDEASRLPPAHWEAIKGSLLAGNAIVLAIGNPTRLQGEFYHAFHGSSHLWRQLHISAFDTPNLCGGSVPGLVTAEGVEEARAGWGEDSPLYQVRILGRFPTAASNQLISLDWIEAALATPVEVGPPALGVDVARSGEDETAVALLVGNRLERIDTWSGQDTMKTAGVVKAYADEWGDLSIAIDDGGVGGGVVDRLREMDVAVHAVKFGAAADGRASVHFKNKLAEMYWTLGERLRAEQLRLPDDRKLLSQLTQLEWEQERQGADGDLQLPDMGRVGTGPWLHTRRRHQPGLTTMWLEVATPIAAGIGSAVAAGISGFRLARGRLSSEDRTAYVRLSAEDSDRVEKINALLERLINLEEQPQEGVTRLAEQVAKVRLDHARRDGFLSGRIDALARPDG